MYDLGITNGKVYIDGEYELTNIYIKDGVISKLSPELLDAKKIYDSEGKLVLPGIIDPHTHFDLDLGTKKSADSFYSGSVSAAYGGVTTFIDFLKPVSNGDDLIEAYKERVLEAKDAVVDYSFHATVANPKGNVDDIVKRVKETGLNTIKLFTTYSDSDRRTYDEEIIQLLKLSKKENFTVLAHIENDELIKLDDSLPYQKLEYSRNTESETSEALKLASFARETQGNLYMVHLSSGDTLKALKEKFSDILNKNFKVESCPHYFSFTKSVFNQDDGYLYTMAPPLRSRFERIKLINNLEFVDTIGTDHCPFTKEQKNKTLLKDMALGIGSVEHSFDIMYGIFQEKVIDKMTVNVAKAHRIFPQKGIIAVGSDADLFIYDLSKPQTITDSHSLCDYEIYDGFKTRGRVESTISRGEFVIYKNELRPNKGTLLKGLII